MNAQVGSLGQELSKEPVGVLIAASLPRRVGIAEVDLDPSVDCEGCVLCHFASLVPGDALSELAGKATNGVRHGDSDLVGGVAVRQVQRRT